MATSQQLPGLIGPFSADSAELHKIDTGECDAPIAHGVEPNLAISPSVDATPSTKEELIRSNCGLGKSPTSWFAVIGDLLGIEYEESNFEDLLSFPSPRLLLPHLAAPP
ncbi:hypothetical protein BDW69DRAFT_185604 [Aspergillus filifer]